MVVKTPTAHSFLHRLSSGCLFQTASLCAMVQGQSCLCVVSKHRSSVRHIQPLTHSKGWVQFIRVARGVWVLIITTLPPSGQWWNWKLFHLISVGVLLFQKGKTNVLVWTFFDCTELEQSSYTFKCLISLDNAERERLLSQEDSIRKWNWPISPRSFFFFFNPLNLPASIFTLSRECTLMICMLHPDCIRLYSAVLHGDAHVHEQARSNLSHKKGVYVTSSKSDLFKWKTIHTYMQISECLSVRKCSITAISSWLTCSFGYGRQERAAAFS